MSRHYVQVYYHIVWTTYRRSPLIPPDAEPMLHGMLWRKCEALKLIPCAINGMDDHIHVVINARPDIAPAEIIRQLKGSSSHYMSDKGHPEFQWQRGYGLFSVSPILIDKAIDYVQNQKAHHANGTIIERFETIDPDA